MQPQFTMKILVAGDGGAGKSTLINYKRTGEFRTGSTITIGVDFAIIPVCFLGKTVYLQMWDLGGQKQFQFIHNAYIKGTRAAILTYDLTRPHSFDHLLEHWLPFVYSENPSLPIVVVGTKKDLVGNVEQIEYAMHWKNRGEDRTNRATFLGHFLISSKTGDGIERVFEAILTHFTPLLACGELEKSPVVQNSIQ
jgi:small GTP-binding protein